jgi:S1-C subfamily serine protease
MIARDLRQFTYQPDPLPRSESTSPRRRSRLRLAAFFLAVVLGGIGIGAAASGLLERGQGGTPAATTPSTSGSAASTASGVDAGAASAARSATALSAESIYAQDLPSVVTISTEVVGRFGQSGQGTGSGIVLDSRGDIVTNAHVIAGAQQVSVTFSDGTTAAATIIGSDSSADLAVLRVNVNASRLHPISLGSSSNVQVGDRVYAIGAPFGLSGTLTEGVVSGLDRSNSSAGGAGDLIQTDAAINPGNSGGALLNTQGQLVGITESIESPVNGNVGVGFAIPVDKVQSLLPSLEA